MQIIGRQREIEELSRLELTNQSEFVVVYGRRRVGKTFLIRQYFNDKFTFYTTGLSRGSRKQQIHNFSEDLHKQCQSLPTTDANDWFEVFDRLKKVIQKSRQSRKVVFLDELPWMHTQKSEFVSALDLFWNEWGCMQDKLLLIVCGSAAGWMVKNIIDDTGGLHGRMTCKIHLSPFTLGETKLYLQKAGMRWTDELIAECYMVLGGIPYYLHLLDKSLSPAQNIDRLFFKKEALLKDEFQLLFNSLFKKSADYVRIIESLSNNRNGLTRDEISSSTKLNNGGGLTQKLKELEQCGFIRFHETANSREQFYQLIDFYCLFYYMFVCKNDDYDQDIWLHFQGKPAYNTWLGLSFERLCFAHAEQIRQALGINGVATKTYSFLTEKTQMDMVIERGDKVINLCEMKYTKLPYAMTQEDVDNIDVRTECLQKLSHQQRTIMPVLVTKQPAKKNEYYTSRIIKNITLIDLMR